MKRPPIKTLAWLGLTLLLASSLGAWSPLSAFFKTVGTGVASFTPTGEVASSDVVVRITFSQDVVAEGDLGKFLVFNPPLPGSVRLEDSRTLVFTPSQPLRPATSYTVQLVGAGLKPKNGGLLQKSADVEFHTPPFRAEAPRLFYKYNPFDGTERELVAELNFNLPLSAEALRGSLSLTKDGQASTFKLEASRSPRRFYVSTGGLQRGAAEQKFRLTVRKGLLCDGCGAPLADELVSDLALPAKPVFELQEAKCHQAPGSTTIGLQFSLPVSTARLKAHLRLDPAIPFSIETEHTYAILKGDFQPNISYKLFVSGGLSSEDGQALLLGDRKPGDPLATVTIQDLPPTIRFGDQGSLSSLHGPLNVAVKTVNLDKFHISVRKIYRNNLLRYLNGNAYDTSRALVEKDVDVKGGQINAEVESDLNLSAWHQGAFKGLYQVSLQADGAGGHADWMDEGDEGDEGDGGRVSNSPSQRTFLVTDLGLVTKRSDHDLWVQVLSVSTLEPVPGVRLDLVSSSNQVMASQVSDTQGRAEFHDLDKRTEESFDASLLTAEKGDDFAYLPLARQPLPTAHFDVGGDPYTRDGMEGFLCSDRGLYRPGDLAHFTAIVRNRDLSPAPALPLTLRLTHNGDPVAELVAKAGAEGMAVFDWPIPASLATGPVEAWLGLSNNVTLGSASIKVEEFIPQKIRVSAQASTRTAVAGVPLSVTVQADQLFGGPAQGLRARGRISWMPRLFEPEGWPGYHFADDTRVFSGQTDELPEADTDADGRAAYPLMVPDSLQPPSMLTALVQSEVLDTGGRPVGAGTSFLAHVYDTYFGLKLPTGQALRAHQGVHLDLGCADPNGAPAGAKKVMLLIKRKVFYSIFRQKGRHWRGWDSATYEEPVLAKEVDISGRGGFDFTPDKPGDYTVLFGREDGHRASLSLPVSAEAADEDATSNLDAPERLGLTLDKARYKAGEDADVTVHAPFAGRLVISLEREKPLWASTVAVPAGVSHVRVHVGEEALPNAYVVGLLARRPSESLRDLPAVSYGVTPLFMNLGRRQLHPRFEAPASVGSRDGINAEVVVEGGAGAQVVVAAVDEGILQIINFTSPDPFSFFYRKRGLSTHTSTGLDELLPDLARKEVVGGDEDEGVARRHLNPVEAKRVKSFAWFSGRLTLGPDGRVKVKVPTLGFRGEARLMALAVQGQAFGGGSAHVKVADPVIVEAPAPRFLAPGDDFEVPAKVFNRTEHALALTVSLTLDGPLAADGAATRSLSLDAGGQTLVSFHAKALREAGKAHLRVTARSDAGEFYDETELPVRPPNALRTTVESGKLGPGASATLNVPGGMLKEGLKARLAVSDQRLLLYLRSLDYLIAYPYGCGEQVTSKAFPLLYFKDLGLVTGRFSDRAGAVERDVQAAIDKLARMQTADGGFTYWEGGDSSDEWLSDYVTHFLLEAKRLRYDVPAKVMDAALKRLGAIQVDPAKRPKGRLDRRQDNVDDGTVINRPYVLYLKALAGVPDRESMEAFRRQDLSKVELEDRCMVSLAYSAAGDRGSAAALLPQAGWVWKLARLFGGNLSSPNRETSLVLMALSQCAPADPRVEAMIDVLGKRMKDGHFGTTQEDAWAFRALGAAINATQAQAPVDAQWSLDDGPAQDLKGLTPVLADPGLSGHRLKLSNAGSAPLYYYMMSEGTPLEEQPAKESEGIQAKRSYYDEHGAELNLGSVAQGQVVLVRLEVTLKQDCDNLVIVDLLPAGLEVENTRLGSQANGLSLPGGASFTPQNADYRDDRVLLFTGAASGTLNFSYACRAVTPGRFKVPSLLVEAMYEPELRARSLPAGDLVVARRRP